MQNKPDLALEMLRGMDPLRLKLVIGRCWKATDTGGLNVVDEEDEEAYVGAGAAKKKANQALHSNGRAVAEQDQGEDSSSAEESSDEEGGATLEQQGDERAVVAKGDLSWLDDESDSDSGDPKEDAVDTTAELRQTMQDESSMGMSILSSLFGGGEGSAARATDAESGLLSNAGGTGVPGIMGGVPGDVRPSRPANAFKAVERYWGGESDYVPPVAALEEAAEVVAPADVVTATDAANADAAANAPIVSTKQQTLKAMFDSNGPKPTVPEVGFAKDENPLTLTGFMATNERETKTQAHSFNFFSAPDGESDSSHAAAEAAAAALEPSRTVEPAGAQQLVLGMWSDYGRMLEQAGRFADPSAPPDDPSKDLDWREHRHGLMRDVKRKHRIALKVEQSKRKKRPALRGLGLVAAVS